MSFDALLEFDQDSEATSNQTGSASSKRAEPLTKAERQNQDEGILSSLETVTRSLVRRLQAPTPNSRWLEQINAPRHLA